MNKSLIVTLLISSATLFGMENEQAGPSGQSGAVTRSQKRRLDKRRKQYEADWAVYNRKRDQAIAELTTQLEQKFRKPDRRHNAAHNQSLDRMLGLIRKSNYCLCNFPEKNNGPFYFTFLSDNDHAHVGPNEKNNNELHDVLDLLSVEEDRGIFRAPAIQMQFVNWVKEIRRTHPEYLTQPNKDGLTPLSQIETLHKEWEQHPIKLGNNKFGRDGNSTIWWAYRILHKDQQQAEQSNFNLGGLAQELPQIDTQSKKARPLEKGKEPRRKRIRRSRK